MRTRILVARYELEFEGSVTHWNQCLRPIFGGPEMKETVVAKANAPSDDKTETDSDTESSTGKGSENGTGTEASAPTEGDGYNPAAKRRAPRTAKSPPPIAASGPATDFQLLYDDLAKAGGRRAEKDAILATVWLLGGTQHDVTFDDVARSMRAVEHFCDVRVKPHLLKHCSRSRMLEPGAERETVRMTKKGIRYIASLMG